MSSTRSTPEPDRRGRRPDDPLGLGTKVTIYLSPRYVTALDSLIDPARRPTRSAVIRQLLDRTGAVEKTGQAVAEGKAPRNPVEVGERVVEAKHRLEECEHPRARKDLAGGGVEIMKCPDCGKVLGRDGTGRGGAWR